MIDWDKWQEIFSSIRRHKLRTILTALGVFWGIFMLVILLGAGQGLQNGVAYEFRDDAINSVWVRRGTTSMPYQGLPKGRRIVFNNDNYDYLSEFESVDALTGRYYLSGGNQMVRYGKKSLSFTTTGVHPGHKVIENSILVEGRFINERDIQEVRKVVVIGLPVQRELFAEQNPIGEMISIGGISYKIIGVYKDIGGEEEMRTLYIPISTAQKVYAGTENLHQLIFTVDGLSVEETNQLTEIIRKDLARQLQFDPADRRALYVFNQAESYQEFMNLFTAIRIFVWFVGLGSIIAGVIGVSNIMLIVVKDRTKEIGIRKALGATPYSIVSMILQEAVFITAIAGYLGLLSGVGVIFLMREMEVEYFRNPTVNLGVAVAATVVLILAGALAGLMPALQAARINPVVAMKSD
ncbi:MAG: ABC transporter permease [Saprospiraceae bacterium]|nr:ABC transporter permease [Saprospiraceae bacterium]